MGEPLSPLPVKLVVGLIFGDEPTLKKTLSHLLATFGAVDFAGPILDFDKTSYYEKEMGKPLKRKFLSFEKLISPGKLVPIKHLTNTLEKKMSRGGRRSINIDPGYITLSKLVLASTKNFCHRIYAGKGIFEEITLAYKNKTFHPGKWTYPDYGSFDHIEIFNRIRDIYYRQLEKQYGLAALYRCV